MAFYTIYTVPVYIQSPQGNNATHFEYSCSSYFNKLITRTKNSKT